MCLWTLLPFLGLVWGCSSSSDDEEETGSGSLTVEWETNFIDCEGGEILVKILTKESWTASFADPVSWCTLSPQSGTGNDVLTLRIEPNMERTSRNVYLNVHAERDDWSMTFTQEGRPDEHYELPVIFHVLYKDKSDPLQYVPYSRLKAILAEVNNMYRGEFTFSDSDVKSEDMNLEFKLAETDEKGKKLTNPGVEYVSWSGGYPIDCYAFMNDNSGKYTSYLWEPNDYINIMVYNFAVEEGAESTTLGISHLPYTRTGSTYLEGTNGVSSPYLEKSSLYFPYCVSINSLYINEQSTENSYSTADVTVTLAHELGHYLGLHHVFSESQEDGSTLNSCVDSDYCADTPTYDKVAYDANFEYARTHDPETNFTFNNLLKRTNCEGEQFVSHNVMDYAVSWSDEFTADQRVRIRHVLNYGLLIPGPKMVKAARSDAPEGKVNLPIRAVR